MTNYTADRQVLLINNRFNLECDWLQDMGSTKVVRTGDFVDQSSDATAQI